MYPRLQCAVGSSPEFHSVRPSSLGEKKVLCSAKDSDYPVVCFLCRITKRWRNLWRKNREHAKTWKSWWGEFWRTWTTLLGTRPTSEERPWSLLKTSYKTKPGAPQSRLAWHAGSQGRAGWKASCFLCIEKLESILRIEMVTLLLKNPSVRCRHWRRDRVNLTLVTSQLPHFAISAASDYKSWSFRLLLNMYK